MNRVIVYSVFRHGPVSILRKKKKGQKEARSTTDCSVQVLFHRISPDYRGLLHLHHANLGASTQPTGKRTRTSSTKSQQYFNTFFMKLTS